MLKEIERSRINSTHIKSIGHDKQERLLQVEFLSGTIWNYYDVSEGEYLALLDKNTRKEKFQQIKNAKTCEAVVKEPRRAAEPERMIVVKNAEKGGKFPVSSKLHELVRASRK